MTRRDSFVQIPGQASRKKLKGRTELEERVVLDMLVSRGGAILDVLVQRR